MIETGIAGRCQSLRDRTISKEMDTYTWASPNIRDEAFMR